MWTCAEPSFLSQFLALVHFYSKTSLKEAPSPIFSLLCFLLSQAPKAASQRACVCILEGQKGTKEAALIFLKPAFWKTHSSVKTRPCYPLLCLRFEHQISATLTFVSFTNLKEISRCARSHRSPSLSPVFSCVFQHKLTPLLCYPYTPKEQSFPLNLVFSSQLQAENHPLSKASMGPITEKLWWVGEDHKWPVLRAGLKAPIIKIRRHRRQDSTWIIQPSNPQGTHTHTHQVSPLCLHWFAIKKQILLQ